MANYTWRVVYRYVALMWMLAAGSVLADGGGLIASVLNCFRTDFAPWNRPYLFQKLQGQFASPSGAFFRTMQTASLVHLDNATYGMGPQDKTFKIGSGSTGAAHFVRPEKGEGYVLKTFFDPNPVEKVHQGIEAERTKFDLLARALERIPGSSLKVVSATRVGPDGLKTAYAHGQRLDAFLEDPEVPDPVKRFVIGIYNHDVTRLGEEMMNDRELASVRDGKQVKGGPAVARTWKHYFLRGNTLLGFDIRPDQVVVNPDTLELTIVDPW